MRLTFLGKDTQGGNSPTLWETDDGQYVIQGLSSTPKPWPRSEPYRTGRPSSASRRS
jgi:hypothetical protein